LDERLDGEGLKKTLGSFDPQGKLSVLVVRKQGAEDLVGLQGPRNGIHQ
jgi:hypothetical protein